jgi:hypothetical protein
MSVGLLSKEEIMLLAQGKIQQKSELLPVSEQRKIFAHKKRLLGVTEDGWAMFESSKYNFLVFPRPISFREIVNFLSNRSISPPILT